MTKKTKVNLLRPRRRFYWAYGSNLNVAAMRIRCPRARKVKRLVCNHVQLSFRMVADVDIIDDPDMITPGGLWEITPECERALDRYEGFDPRRPDDGLYRKMYFRARIEGERRKVMFYKMCRPHGIVPPSEGYYNVILRGYEDFGLDPRWLKEALDRSWDEKNWTDEIKRRWNVRGRPNFQQNQGDEDDDEAPAYGSADLPDGI